MKGIIVAGVVLSAGAAVAGPAEDAKLSVKARIDDGLVLVDFELANAGKAPLWANTRMSVDADSCSPQHAQLLLALYDARDRRLPWRCVYKNAAVTPRDYALLGPGQKVTGQFNLTDCYEFQIGEKIEVRATWQDPNPQPPPAPAGATPLRERLVAQPAKFTAPDPRPKKKK